MPAASPFQLFQRWAEALQVVWPYGEAAGVQEVVERLGERWSPAEKEAAVWKKCADAARVGIAGRSGKYPTDPTDPIDLSCS